MIGLERACSKHYRPLPAAAGVGHEGGNGDAAVEGLVGHAQVPHQQQLSLVRPSILHRDCLDVQSTFERRTSHLHEAVISCRLWSRLQVVLTSDNGRRSGNYLFGRLFDKTCFAFLTATFYWRTGAVMDPANAPNLAGLLFMWCVPGLPVPSAGCALHVSFIPVVAVIMPNPTLWTQSGRTRTESRE